MADPNTTATFTSEEVRILNVQAWDRAIAAASTQVAEHYKALQQKGRQAEADIAMANKMLESVVLAELASLQDRINRLRAPEAATDV